MWLRQFYWLPANTQVKMPDDLRPIMPATQADIPKILLWDWLWISDQRPTSSIAGTRRCRVRLGGGFAPLPDLPRELRRQSPRSERNAEPLARMNTPAESR
jgi:hypothetical protein